MVVNCQKLENATCHHEDMKHGVHPAHFAADAIKNSAETITDSACQKKEESPLSQNLNGLGEEGQDRPAQADVEHHGQLAVLLQIDSCQRRRQGRQRPLQDKQPPTNLGVHRSQGDQYNWSITAGDEQVYGAVVNDLQHFLPKAWLQSVVNAGNGIEEDQTAAVNSACRNGDIPITSQ